MSFVQDSYLPQNACLCYLKQSAFDQQYVISTLLAPSSVSPSVTSQSFTFRVLTDKTTLFLIFNPCGSGNTGLEDISMLIMPLPQSLHELSQQCSTTVRSFSIFRRDASGQRSNWHNHPLCLIRKPKPELLESSSAYSGLSLSAGLYNGEWHQKFSHCAYCLFKQRVKVINAVVLQLVFLGLTQGLSAVQLCKSYRFANLQSNLFFSVPVILSASVSHCTPLACS